ncbi:hypothetical protein [Paenibacillus marinisediminis]
MSKKQRIIFRASLALNAVLIIILVIGYLKVNLAHEQLFYNEVQWRLVELDGLIEHQKKNDWTEPNLVTTQLGDILNGINVATSNGHYSGWLSSSEEKTMQRLYAALMRYPHDDLYDFSKVSQSDIESFERLQSHLQQAGFAMNKTLSNNWNSFMSRSESLLKIIP